jgi:hypothetical protein
VKSFFHKVAGLNCRKWKKQKKSTAPKSNYGTAHDFYGHDTRVLSLKNIHTKPGIAIDKGGKIPTTE